MMDGLCFVSRLLIAEALVSLSSMFSHPAAIFQVDESVSSLQRSRSIQLLFLPCPMSSGSAFTWELGWLYRNTAPGPVIAHELRPAPKQTTLFRNVHFR
ncbi:hypothetical protein BDW74DRAFT_144043 [Aspergillus multicolor]|uniref:uncharacterized protein n=1 Tax=Aspergillus multicolor TaxID=41759 RepID=UPI003CCDE23E